MNEILKTIVSNGCVTTEDGKVRSLVSAISIEEGNFVQEMIRSTRPRISLEIGFGYGISSLYICEALCEVNATKHIIVDPYEHSEFEGIGISNIIRAGYLNIVDFHEAASYLILPRLIEDDLTIDFAFIDGHHMFDYVLTDFFLVDKLLKPGGIVILDDLSWPPIRSVCRFVLSNLRYKCIGPQSQELPERTALRNVASRVHQHGIGPLLRSPRRRILTPARRMLMWRLGQLVSGRPRRHTRISNFFG